MKLTLKDFMKNLIDSVYKNNDVTQGFFYWQGRLIDEVIDCFEYAGLPDSLPAEEIEKRLLTTGFSIIFKHPIYDIMTCNGHPYNFDIYGRFKNANVYNPVSDFMTKGFNGAALTIGKDCVVIYNNSLEKYLNQPFQSRDIFFQTVCRYARQLADLEATINLEIINERQPYVFVAGDNKAMQGILDVFRNIRKGSQYVALDKNLYKETTAFKNHDIVNGHLTELIENRNRILKQFQEEIGIFSIDDKEVQVLNAEIENENRNVKLFIYSMLKARQIGVDSLNKMFDLNVSVKLRSSIYDDSKLYEETPDVVSDIIEEIKKE